MDFISNKSEQIKAMLAEMGIKDVMDLFVAIPPDLKLNAPQLDDGLSEYEGLRLMEEIAQKNTFPQYDNYIGAGAYEHHVPALVNAICSKSEFLTSYTPYQAEASQGMLQATFEFQSAICALTGMDVANASVYDGASACAEAVLMALRLKNNRNKILIAHSVHPHYRGVIQQYLTCHDCLVETIDFHLIKEKIDEQTAAVLIQSPNFFGVIEPVKELFERAKQQGALSLLCANPLAYGLFASAAELGADIAIGDTQPFGLPLQFGGPYVGYMACRQEFVRQLPGRLVGETVDQEGKRGFVLTLQAREQHIRREKATSNICTNQALAALASLVAILWYGKEGIKELALTNYQRATFLKAKLAEIEGIQLLDSHSTTFNEFVVRFDRPINDVLDFFRKKGIQPGLALEHYYPEMKNCLLIAVTETKNLKQLERFVELAKEVQK